MRTETIAALRMQIAGLERRSATGSPSLRLPFGVPELDACLPGQGLALGAMHELFAGGPAIEHGAAPALFAAGVLARRAGPVLWITGQRDLYPPALARAGLDPARMILVKTRHGALRAMEESLRHPGLAGVVCEHEGRLDLVASRRLQLAAGATDRRARLRPAPVAALRRSGAECALRRGDPLADYQHALTPAIAACPGRARPRPPALAAGAVALPWCGGGQLRHGESGCAGSSRCSCLPGRPTACAGMGTQGCRRTSLWSPARMTAGAW